MFKLLRPSELKLLVACGLAWVFIIASVISLPVLVYLERNSERNDARQRELVTQRIISGQAEDPSGGYHDAWYYARFSPK
jgi:hypothetical protein